LLGFTYAPVILHDVFSNALELDQKEIDYEIFYTDLNNKETLIYDHDNHMNYNKFISQSDSSSFLNNRINYENGKLSYANINFNYSFSSLDKSDFKYYWHMWIEFFIVELIIWSLGILLVINIMRKKEDAQLLADKMTISYKKSKEDAEHATKMKSVFLATMSHEIRTPLNGVLGLTQVLLETNLEIEQRKYVETILNSGESLLGIITDALDYSKIESGKMNLELIDFDLKKLVQEVSELYRGQASIQGTNLILEIDSTLPLLVNGDSLKVRQILQNIINNAIKFTQDGSVEISVKTITSSDQCSLMRFEIRDTGIGIPEDKIAFLFQEFSQVDNSTTRKYGGSGLGLTISKLLIEMMNGKIEVKSSLGIGTSFIIEIPFKKIIHDTLTDKNILPFFSFKKGLRILLVEDNPVNQLVATKLLQSRNAVVESANNGVEALALMESNTYDIILMDCFMPILDGYETSKKIRLNEKRKNIIIALTANSSQEDIQKCIDCGMDDFISKPFNINKMLQVINKYAA
jgi:signal transduction histidine kinase